MPTAALGRAGAQKIEAEGAARESWHVSSSRPLSCAPGAAASGCCSSSDASAGAGCGCSERSCGGCGAACCCCCSVDAPPPTERGGGDGEGEENVKPCHRRVLRVHTSLVCAGSGPAAAAALRRPLRQRGGRKEGLLKACWLGLGRLLISSSSSLSALPREPLGIKPPKNGRGDRPLLWLAARAQAKQAATRRQRAAKQSDEGLPPREGGAL